LLGKPSNVLNKLFMNLYDKVDSQNYANSVLKTLSERAGDAEFPTDKSVFKKLKEEKIFKSKNKRCLKYLNYLFTRLENHGSKNSKWISEDKNLSLGRIFPSKDFANSEDFANWAQNLSEQELDEMLERCDTLANLAYSGCKDEKESFTHKKMIADNCYDQTPLWTNRYLKEIENWGLEELNKRHEILMERFFLVWKAPLEINKTANAKDNTLKNIFEIGTATYKKVKKAVWKGQELDLKDYHFSSFFIKVMEILLENHENEILKEKNLCNRLKLCPISNVKSNNLRMPALIGKNYVIETKNSRISITLKRSSDDNLKLLQEILTALNLRDALYLQLVTI
jgi:hypothetical protein